MTVIQRSRAELSSRPNQAPTNHPHTATVSLHRTSREQEREREDGTHQIALALKNTRLCGHVSMLFWPSLQISWTVENSAAFTPTCKNPERSVATAWATNDARGGIFM